MASQLLVLHGSLLKKDIFVRHASQNPLAIFSGEKAPIFSKCTPRGNLLSIPFVIFYLATPSTDLELNTSERFFASLHTNT